MKTVLIGAALVLSSAISASAQAAYPQPADLQTYYIYFLNKGPNHGKGTAEEQKDIQAKHMAHLNSLGAKIAGPFGTDGPRRGLVILQAESVAAARAKGEADPAVKAGTFTVEAFTMVVPRNWFDFGPAEPPYKMRRFVFMFLDTGPARSSTDPAVAAKLMDGHLGNLYRLAQEGKLELAGPLTDGGDHRGIVVLRTESIDEAQRWMADDPMIKAGYMVMVPLQWFAADGIMQRR